MVAHEIYIQRCIQLARLGAGFTAPNPMVGAVLVYNDRIIGEGWHQHYGGHHAEVNCIQSVALQDQQYIAQSVLYVSLEPCAHHGKTPPCADFIVTHNIHKVVVGCIDPFAQVSGAGIQKLKDAGIEVIMPVLEEECISLNKVFFTFHRKQRPYIVLKWAQTQDGFIAPVNKGNFNISNQYSKILLHKWRSDLAAIAVGFNTVVADNPQLNNRHWNSGQQPVRVIFDPRNELPCDRNVFDGNQITFIYNQHFTMDGEMTQWIKISNPQFLQGVFQDLYQKNINSILIEGGAKTLQSLLEQGLYDEIIVIENEQLLTDGIAAPAVPTTQKSHMQQIENDKISYYFYD